jgi:signal transduction protein with GAF and PtsI domain
MTSVGDVVSLLELITIETKELLNADRVSIFLLDREKCELWSMISQEKRIIRFDARLGIAGSVAMTGQTINVADAYEHPLFHKEVIKDRLSHANIAGRTPQDLRETSSESAKPSTKRRTVLGRGR